MVFRTVCVAALAAAASAVPQETALPGTPAYRPLPVGDVVPEVRLSIDGSSAPCSGALPTAGRRAPRAPPRPALRMCLVGSVVYCPANATALLHF